MKRGLLSCLFVTLAGTTGLAGNQSTVADTTAVRLSDSIVVVADRFGRPPEQVIWPVSVIRRDDLRTAVTLASATDGFGGADVRQTSGVGSVATLSNWGSFNRHMLLLYDGRPVRDYSLGGFNLSDFSPAEFERVELLKGPHTALYGSDAVGGVLNLIPRSTLLDKIEYRGTVGTLGLQEHNFWLSHRRNRTGYGLSTAYGRAENRRPNSGSEHLVLNGRVDMVANDSRQSLRFSVRYFEDSLGAPGPAPDPALIPTYGSPESSSLVDHQRDRNYSLDAGFKKLVGENAELGLDLFWEKKTLEFRSTYDYFGEVNTLSRYHKRSSGASARIKNEATSVGLAGGLDWLSGSLLAIGEETGESGYASRSDWGAGQDQFDLWSSITMRPHRSVSFETTGRAGMIHNRPTQPSVTTGLLIGHDGAFQVRLGFGFAYRLPSLADQFADDVYVAGKADLSLEKARTFTVGTNWSGAGLVRTITIVTFHQRVADLIQYSYDPAIFRSVPRNVETYKSTGVDWQVSLVPTPSVDISFAGVWQDAVQTVAERQQNVRAFYTPKLKLMVAGDWQAHQVVTLRATAGHTGARETRLYDGGVKRLAAVWEMGASLTARLHRRLQVTLSGSDLTDQRRPDQFGFTATDRDYPGLGRQVRLSLGTEI